MERYNTNKSSPGFNEKPGNGPCSSLPSLAHVFAVVTALVFIGIPVIYSLSAQRAHAALVEELRAEVRDLKERVDQLEARDTAEITTNRNQNRDKYLKRLLMDFSEEKPKEKRIKDSEGRVNFLDKLFGRRELDSESDAQWIADLQNTGPSSLEPEMLSDDISPQMSHEGEDNIFYLADGSAETPLHHHGEKLSTNHAQARGDVRREATNRERARRRPRRQAENRESRNQNRESRNRNRDRKASKGAGKRNRGNGGSTGRGEQGGEETQHRNGGERRQGQKCQCPEERRQRSRCQCPQEHQPAYVHFVGNVSSRVHTDPERIHPLSPRMVNITENLLSDWVYARWTLRRQKAKFVLNEGVVTVVEPGTYYIYSQRSSEYYSLWTMLQTRGSHPYRSNIVLCEDINSYLPHSTQVQFFDDERYTGHVITINDEETFKCAESPPQRPRNMHTCHIGGLAYLHRDSRVAVRVAFPYRWVNMHPDSSYFGMYKVA